MITTKKAIEAIQEKIAEIESIKHYDQFNPWRMATIGTLKRVVPYNVSVFEHLLDIKSKGNYNSDLKESAKRDSKILLDSLIKDIERFGLEEPLEVNTEREVIKVDVNQSNHQNQSTTVSINLQFIFDVIKGELRDSELDELKEILESDEIPKVKKERFVDKVKSFGSDVASNILASILTNPLVYEQLSKMI